ncbi:acetate--CoA ligase family protein [Orrella sp. 11846]|uniref:acetate--CoA ligase family protein n=1 Tax=Orrella sp. 11846 TaxID=3409913 RepID=UPI003B5A95F2
MNSIQKLINPKHVAVVGASSDPKKISGRPVYYLQQHGFSGTIMPINPRASQIGGLPCYPDIESLPVTPDVAIVLLGVDGVPQALRDLAKKGCAAAIVLGSGYAETGEIGAQRQTELLEAAGEMRILGPNTIGLINLTQDIVLSPSGALALSEFPKGQIGVVSQSGGIVGALLSRAVARGIGLSTLVSSGNEADLELSDFIEYLAQDPNTKVIALYIEAIRHPDKFRRACEKAQANGKPVVVFKIGRSEAGAQAAVSHTGAMAGSDRLYDVFFEQIGVIRVNDIDDLLGVSAALATTRNMAGNRVAILTSTGGAGTLVSDELGVLGLSTPAPEEETSIRLRSLQIGPETVLDRNPIDVTLAGLKPTLLRNTIQTLLQSSSYDALVIIVGASGLTMPDLMVDAIGACLPESDKPVMAYVSPHAPDIARRLTNMGVPAFTTAFGCAVALQALWKAHQTTPSDESQPVVHQNLTDEYAVSGLLDEAQSKSLFSQFGIPAVPERIVSNVEQAIEAAHALGPRVVLKVLSSQVAHKSEIGGVEVGIVPEKMQDSYTRMASTLEKNTPKNAQQFLVQKMIDAGVEIILGSYREPLGTVVLVGMGGVTAELFNDTAMRVLNRHQNGQLQALTQSQALVMLKKLTIWPLLQGYRNQVGVDIDALTQVIVDFSVFVAQFDDRLLEAEINPLFVLPQGQGVFAADGLVLLK